MVREGIWPARHRGPASSIVELSVTWKVIARDEWKARKECATSRRFKTARNRGPLIWAAIVAAADSLEVVVVSEAAAAGAVDPSFCHCFWERIEAVRGADGGIEPGVNTPVNPGNESKNLLSPRS